MFCVFCAKGNAYRISSCLESRLHLLFIFSAEGDTHGIGY
jgi:hypothetical protein